MVSVSMKRKPKNEQANKIIVLQRQTDIIKMLLDGKDSREIRDYVCDKYKVLPMVASQYLTQARKEIKKYRERQVDNVLSIHIQRYEEVYSKLYEINAYSLAMSALQAKEKLLGMHKQDFRLQVNNIDATAVIGGPNAHSGMSYELDRLGKRDRLRLQLLLDKCKKNDRNKKNES